jgi:hypothetical protein
LPWRNTAHRNLALGRLPTTKTPRICKPYKFWLLPLSSQKRILQSCCFIAGHVGAAGGPTPGEVCSTPDHYDGHQLLLKQIMAGSHTVMIGNPPIAALLFMSPNKADYSGQSHRDGENSPDGCSYLLLICPSSFSHFLFSKNLFPLLHRISLQSTLTGCLSCLRTSVNTMPRLTLEERVAEREQQERESGIPQTHDDTSVDHYPWNDDTKKLMNHWVCVWNR